VNEESTVLEKLAGRLKWKHTGGKIRVEIPVRGKWALFVLAIFLAVLWALGVLLYRHAYPPENDAATFWACVVSGTAGICFIAFLLVMWSIAGKTILTLDPLELKLQKRVLGIEWGAGTFATNSVCSLRYIPPTYLYAFRTDTDPSTSKVVFQTNNKTRSFAGGITEREACALIDCMLEVYQFPKDRRLNYSGTTS
jgi:hypothetical protein